MDPWMIPNERYYYDWYSPTTTARSRGDAAIKSEIVDRLRINRYTADHQIKVDVKAGVVIVQGQVSSRLAKRAAGDDCWDTDGVADVSNQLTCNAETDDDVEAPVVRQVMSTDPHTARTETTVSEAARMMAEFDVGDLIVLDDESNVVGIVTDRDMVVRGLAADLSPIATVADVMTTNVIGVAPDSPTDHAIALIIDAAVRRLPVVDEGRLVGVVSLGDLARRRDPGSALARIIAAPPQL